MIAPSARSGPGAGPGSRARPAAASASLAVAVAVVGVVAPVSTLVTPIVGVKLPSAGASATLPGHASGHLYTNTGTTQDLSIHAFHSILCVSGVLKFHKGKAGRVPCHPYSPQWAVITEGSLQLPLGSAVTKVTDIDLAVGGPGRAPGGRIVRHLSSTASSVGFSDDASGKYQTLAVSTRSPWP